MATGPVRLIVETTSAIERLSKRSIRGGDLTHLVAQLAFVRCLSRYQAVGLLLSQDLPDDALILMRSLLLDSQRLQYLGRHPAKRDGLLLGWFGRGVADLNAQVLAGGRAGSNVNGLADFARTMSPAVADYRATLEHIRVRKGIGRLPSFPAEGRDMAVALGHPDDEFDYVFATNSSHTSMSSSFRHLSGEPEAVTISVRNRDPELGRVIADRATRHALRASVGAGDVLGWDTAAKLGVLARAVIAKLDADELPERD